MQQSYPSPLSEDPYIVGERAATDGKSEFLLGRAPRPKTLG